MNKKEVAEIKKLFKPEMCNLTRICGCYVDSEKQKVSETKEAFLSIPEEEMFKYFDVFKKNLSGKIGKNLLNLKYETSTYLPGQDLLLGLKDSKLTDNSLIEELFDKSFLHTIMLVITISFLHMVFMISLERQAMAPQCMTLQTKYMTISFAPFVLWISPNRDSATRLKILVLRKEQGIG